MFAYILSFQHILAIRLIILNRVRASLWQLKMVAVHDRKVNVTSRLSMVNGLFTLFWSVDSFSCDNGVLNFSRFEIFYLLILQLPHDLFPCFRSLTHTHTVSQITLDRFHHFIAHHEKSEDVFHVRTEITN